MLIDQCQFMKSTLGVSKGRCLAIVSDGSSNGVYDNQVTAANNIKISSSLFINCGSTGIRKEGGGLYAIANHATTGISSTSAIIKGEGNNNKDNKDYSTGAVGNKIIVRG